ncbi:MAG: VRR-NUC domain-containing protein [Candidatus Competibacterales bacterium]
MSSSDESESPPRPRRRRPPPPELPPKYYRDNFDEFLRFVAHHYGGLLDPEERAFVTCLQGLDEDARCLYARLAHRRGQFFRLDGLNYPEIQDLAAAVATLDAVGLVESLGAWGKTPQSHEPLLAWLTRRELSQILRDLDRWQPSLTKGPKEGLIKALASADGVTPGDLVAAVEARGRVICRRGDGMMAWLRFLFFGRPTVDLSAFVLRDLGYRRVETIDPAQLAPHYQCRAEAVACWAVAEAAAQFAVLADSACPERVAAWWFSWWATRPLEPAARTKTERLARTVGRFFERQSHFEAAERAYAPLQQPPARERRVRLLQRLGRKAEALALAEAMATEPGSAEEAIAAADIIARLKSPKRPLKRATATLRAAPSVALDPRFRGAVEQGVIHHLHGEGLQAIHSENWLWCGLFGLLFWDVLYDGTPGAFHHPLQMGPADLARDNFYHSRRAAIEAQLALLEDPSRCLALLGQRFEAKRGLTNPFVVWHPGLLSAIAVCLGQFPSPGIARVLEGMAQDPRHSRRGFPDLLVWGAGGGRLVEVKGPNDQLSALQLHWLEFFNRVEIDAQVLQVSWKT